MGSREGETLKFRIGTHLFVTAAILNPCEKDLGQFKSFFLEAVKHNYMMTKTKGSNHSPILGSGEGVTRVSSLTTSNSDRLVESKNTEIKMKYQKHNKK